MPEDSAEPLDFSPDPQSGKNSMQASETHFDAGTKRRRNRAVDLLPVDSKNQVSSQFDLSNAEDLKTLVQRLEEDGFTGCVKVSSSFANFRAGLLLSSGRVLGCVYGHEGLLETYPTKKSLEMTFSRCLATNSRAQLFSVEESIVVAMSALFLGYPLSRSEGASDEPSVYFGQLLHFLQEGEQTGCLVVSHPGETVLAFVFKGAFVASFHVESQLISRDIDAIWSAVRTAPEAWVEASIFTKEQMNEELGFKLRIDIQD